MPRVSKTTRWFSALVFGLIWGGCASASPRRVKTVEVFSGNVPVLLYHHVADLPVTASRAERRWTMSPQKFAAQMEWLAARGFHPITMVQLLAHLRHGQSLPVKPIVLTFDDGWKDQYTGAFPILKRYNFPATFFVITSAVGHSAYLTWEQIEDMAAAGMDIQSHSRTHARLSILSREKIRREIVESKADIEQHLYQPVVMLAYPYGSYDDDVIAMAKEAGLAGATTLTGLNGGYMFRKDRSYTLTRYAVEGGENIESIARLKGFASP